MTEPENETPASAEDARPVFEQINLVVADMDATARFYHRLGVDLVEVGGWPPGCALRHATTPTANGARFEADNLDMARVWHAGLRNTEPGVRVVLGFSFPTSEAVDEAYRAATSAGSPGRQPPYDAFWGARYAIVADPDGNDVGLMGPIDRKHGYPPLP